MSEKNIISCLIIDDEPIAREILFAHLSRIDNIKVLAQCASATEALTIIRKNDIDLLFLDINMPNISGITLANSIDSKIKIIFTTAYREYAVEGFELRAVDYLLKPISFDRLLKAVNTYFDLHQAPKSHINTESIENQSFLFVRSERRMIKINFEHINYIESFGDYLKIHTDKKTIVTRETISEIYKNLDARFLRIHRSFIVSVNKITSYTKETITLAGKELPISRSYKSQTIKYLERF